MYFTKQDYERILSYIMDHAKKDSEFETVYNISGQELISLVQDGINKNIKLSELITLFDEHGVEVKIQQEEGDSPVMVMSQKVVTEALDDIRDAIDLDAEKGTVQQQIDEINEHIGGPSDESLQSQIDAINETIGGGSSESLQNQLQDLRDNKLQRGLVEQGGDIVDNLTSPDNTKVLSANQGRVLQENVTAAQNTVDSFIHSTIQDRGMSVSVSGTTLNIEFAASSLNTIYVQKVGDVLSLTNATR